MLHDARGLTAGSLAARAVVVAVALTLVASCSGDGTPAIPTLGDAGEASQGPGGAATVTSSPTGPREPPGAGDPAPGVFGRLLDGGSITVGDVVGRPLIVNFWLTTCEPCIRELPLLSAAAVDHDDLLVVGVNFEEPVDVIESFLATLPSPPGFPIVLDGGDLGRAYEVAVFPTTYFIDVDGVIRYRRIGEVRVEHLEVGLERIGLAGP